MIMTQYFLFVWLWLHYQGLAGSYDILYEKRLSRGHKIHYHKEWEPKKETQGPSTFRYEGAEIIGVILFLHIYLIVC